MPTKTTTVKEVVSKAEGKASKPQQPDVEFQLDPHEVVERSKGESTEEAKAPAPKKAKGEVNLSKLVAFAEFELLGKVYEVGDKVAVPEGWVHEPGFDTFRSSEYKNRGARDLGMAFTVPGEITNKKTGERNYSRQVLPVKEG